MSNYLLEFAIANIILFAIYALFLQKETNIQVKRGYLVIASVFSLIIPLIELPTTTRIADINLVNVLPEISITGPAVSGAFTSPAISDVQYINWLLILYMLVTVIMAGRFIISLVRIYSIFRQSKEEYVNDTKIYTTDAVDSNFTFFNLIFISRATSIPKPEIILHEKAHVKYGHSADLILLNLMLITFWWVPTIWWFLKEIKLVHEYQADNYVINRFDFNTYKTTLITNKLSEQGLFLSNYFNDNQLYKRINNMKNLKLKIKPWKTTMVIFSLALTVYVFACQQQSIKDLNEETTNPELIGEVMETVDVQASFPGGKTELVQYVASNLKYPEEAVENNISGKVFVEFVANKDGSISDVKVLKGIGYGCDKEAKRVIANSVNWTPAELNGEKVRQKLVLPISFSLPGSQKTATAQIEKPSFPGGLEKLYAYIQSNIKYPAEAKDQDVEGTVYVEFTVNADGTIGNVQIARGLTEACDAEAVRVVKSSPKWIPGNDEDGNPVSTTLTLPISFKLS